MKQLYGYGIVDKNGKRETDHVSDDQAKTERAANTLNTLSGNWSDRGPFRTVELFFEDKE